MRIRLIVLCLLLLTMGTARLRAQQEVRPVVMIFPPVMSELIAQDTIGVQAALAMRQALQETDRCEPFLFNPDSLIVKRALTENRLSAADVRRVTSAAQALKIATATDVPYIIYGSILAYTPPRGDTPGALAISLAAVEVETQKAARYNLEASFPARANLASYLAEPARKMAKELVPALAKMAAARQQAREEEAARLRKEKEATRAPTGTGSTGVESPSVQARGDLKESQRHMSLGDTYISQGEVAQAILEYRLAVSWNPWNSEAREKLVRAYERKKLDALAAQEAARALSFDPRNLTLAKMAIRFYLDNGDYNRAEIALKDALRSDPKAHDLQIALGDVYWNQGRLDESLRQYTQVLQDDSGDPTAHERLAKLLAARGQYAESLSHLTAARQGNGSDPYQTGIRIIENEMYLLMIQSENLDKDVGTSRLTRSEAANRCKVLQARAQGLDKFLEGLKPPAGDETPHRRRRFALSLLLQALDLQSQCLTDNDPQVREQAMLLLKESRKELSSLRQSKQGGS